MDANVTIGFSRRKMLTIAAASAAQLTLGFHLPLQQASGQPSTPQLDPNAWLRIESDGSTVVLICQTEMGQGISTGLAAVLCDELGGDWNKVRFEFASGRPDYWHPIVYTQEQLTAGSRSMQAFFSIMRRAGALGRHLLVAAASSRWGVPADTCVAANGYVTHNGRRFGFGELSADAAALPVPATAPQLKNPVDWTLIGKPLKRLDAKLKVTGSAVFGIDVKVPGMLHAAIRHAPVFGATVDHFDPVPALRFAGVHAVEALPGAVAVVADHYWQALMAAKALDVRWSMTDHDTADSESLLASKRAALDSGKAVPAPGSKPVEVAAAFSGGHKVIEAEYELPFLAHAPMEPLGCVANVKADHVELWVSTQGPTWDVKSVHQALGTDPSVVKVTVNMQFCGGGFGRRLGAESVAEAVVLSKRVKRPVKVIWSREEDMMMATLRPSMVMRMRAAIDRDGKPVATHYRIAGGGFWAAQRPHLITKEGLDGSSVRGLLEGYYTVDNQLVEAVQIPQPVRLGTWRSTSNSHNTFFMEVFFDELAAAAGKDPLQYRRELLTDSRSMAVLDAVARRSNWGRQAAGRWQGVAFMMAGNWQTRIAQVAEVSKQGSAYKIEKVFAVVDAGLVINPNLARQMMEGGIVFGLTAALHSEVPVKNGKLQISNFHDYPVLRITEAPPVDIHIMPSTGVQTGSFGEIAVAPLMPALANALSAATGKRIRTLPLGRSGVQLS